MNIYSFFVRWHAHKFCLQISDGDDRALSLVSDLLSGTCDRIYPAAERASVIDAMAKQARKEGLVTPLDDAAAVWELFVRRARLNFHIVLCFSPADCRFHKLLSRYPSLASCTFKHWVRPWSTVALETVGRHLLRSATAQDVPDEQEGDGDDDCQEQLFEEIQIVTDVLVRAFEAMGKTCQSYAEATCTHVHRTPGHYVKLVKTYTALYRKRRAELCSALHRLRRGVHALQQSVKATHSLEATISEMLTVMESIRVNAESMGDRVRSESEAVAAQAAVHNVEAAKVASMSADVRARVLTVRVFRFPCVGLIFFIPVAG
jgi:dynein heavy chain